MTIYQLVGVCAGVMSLAGVAGGVAIAQRDRRLLAGALGVMALMGVLWTALAPQMPNFGFALSYPVVAWALGWAVRRFRARRPEEPRWRTSVIAVAQSSGILIIGLLALGALTALTER